MLSALSMNVNTTYPQFMTVCDGLITCEITWNDVGKLFAFGGLLAVYCCDHDMCLSLSDVTCWISIFTKNKLSNWIRTHGGLNYGFNSLLL